MIASKHAKGLNVGIFSETFKVYFSCILFFLKFIKRPELLLQDYKYSQSYEFWNIFIRAVKLHAWTN